MVSCARATRCLRRPSLETLVRGVFSEEDDSETVCLVHGSVLIFSFVEQIDRRNQTDQTNQLPAMDQEMVQVTVEWYGCDRGVQKPERITGRRTRPSELT